MSGTVYILSNPAMPGIVKIGCTADSAENKAIELRSTGVPVPFKVEYEVRHSYPFALESAVHRELGDYRVNSSREFFHLPLDVAKKALCRLAEGIGVEQRIKALDKRTMLRFSTPSEIGESIRFARRECGLTQEELACVNDVGIRVVSEIENGKATAQLGIVLKLCASLGLFLAVDQP